jgi:hypothetical protein
MANPPGNDRRVEEIVSELQGATLGGHALLAVLPKLRRLLDAERVAAYLPKRAPPAWKLEFAFFEGFPGNPERICQEWLATAPADAFPFDPEHPPAEQRNQVLRARGVYSAEDFAKLPMIRDLFPKLGLSGLDQIRVLVCDGDKLLAWVGAFRSRSFTEEEAQRFQQLVPPMQSRLQLEQSLYR